MFRCIADDCTHPSLSWHGLALHMSHAHPEEVGDEEIATYLIEHLALQLDEIDAPPHPNKQAVADDVQPDPSTIVSYVGSWRACTERALKHRSAKTTGESFGTEPEVQ